MKTTEKIESITITNEAGTETVTIYEGEYGDLHVEHNDIVIS